MKKLAVEYNYGLATLSGIIRKVSSAIVESMESLYIVLPSTKKEWMIVAEKFRKRTYLPNCLGVIDGSHVKVFNPPGGGSLFHNYKGYFSFNLTALVDSDYMIRWYYSVN